MGKFTEHAVFVSSFVALLLAISINFPFKNGYDGEPLTVPLSIDMSTTRASGLDLTPQQWKEDLAYLIKELPNRHPDAFTFTPKEKFEAEAAELDATIEHLNSDEIYIGLDHLANLIGDAHTYVEFPDDNGNLPLDLRHFGTESRIVAVAPGFEQTLGMRVVAIDNTPLPRARELAATITPVAETDWLRDSRIDGFLTTGMALHGLGITPNRNSAKYTLAGDDGKSSTVEFQALAPGQRPKWVQASAKPLLSEQPVNGSAACTYLGDSRALYCNVRRIRDLSGPSKEMFEILKREHPDKLVIDLRRNNGGDYNVGLKYLIEPLRQEPDINKKGHLFVLIGPDTFSAAMSNAAQFRSMTNATLVGLPIGERPNSYQEPKQFTLPNSHLVVRYSTRFYRFADGDVNVVAPDKEIIPTWEDYKNGRDLALEWILTSR